MFLSHQKFHNCLVLHKIYFHGLIMLRIGKAYRQCNVFISFYLFLRVGALLHVYLCPMCTFMSSRPVEVIGFPRTGVVDCYEPPCPRILQGKQVLLTAGHLSGSHVQINSLIDYFILSFCLLIFKGLLVVEQRILECSNWF